MQSAAVDIFAISFPFELLRQRNSSRGNREEQCNVETEVLRQVVAELGIREAQSTGKQVTNAAFFLPLSTQGETGHTGK